jgi:hypothetical protein
MRDEAIVLLAAVSLVAFSMARAQERRDLRFTDESASRESLRAHSAVHGRDSMNDLEGRTMKSVRMITWSDCSSPSSGSAFSIYSRQEKAARFLPLSAMQDVVRSDFCGDDEE